jgi:phosphoglycolate phosphatase-like HAD superfamily hydrolase
MPQRETLMLPGRYRAVVFDVDGLLVTTEPVWAAAEAALLAAHGQAYTEADRRATLGRSVDASIAHYGRRIGARADELPALRAELLETFRARLAAVEAQPGAAPGRAAPRPDRHCGRVQQPATHRGPRARCRVPCQSLRRRGHGRRRDAP